MAASGKAASKNKKASLATNKMIEVLLNMASKTPSYTLEEQATEAKLYEIVVLAKVLSAYGGTVKAITPGGASVFKLAGAPSKANKAKFTYFELGGAGTVEHEVWLSVEVTTLSWHRAGAKGNQLSSRHEVDVGVFSAPLPTESYPSYEQLDAGFSCKHMSAGKVHVRELLGLRRETALLGDPNPSRAPWVLGGNIPAHPASPLFLVSSNPSVLGYGKPIDELGTYVGYIPFP